MLKLNKDTTLHLINFLSSVEHYLSKAEADRRVKQGFVSKWVDVSIQSMSESELDAAIFTVPINALTDIKDLVEQVLSAAEVPRTELGRYTDSPLTIYNLLVELSERTAIPEKIKTKIDAVVEVLDAEYNGRYLKIGLGGLLALLGLEVSMPFGGLGALSQLLTAALFVPAASLAAAVVVGAYYLYKTIFDKTIPFFDKIRDNCFILASSALKLSAYGLALAAACIAAPVISILTVVAQGLSVVHEGFKLIQMKLQGKKEVARADTDSLLAKQQQARSDSHYNQHMKSLWIKLATAVVMTGIVAAWCFIPGGFVVAIVAVALMGAAYYAEWKINKHYEKAGRASLQTTFTELEQEDARCSALKRESTLTDEASAEITNAASLKASPNPSTDDGYSSAPNTPNSEAAPMPLTKGNLQEVVRESKPPDVAVLGINRH